MAGDLDPQPPAASPSAVGSAADAPPPAIELVDVTKTYPGVRALDRVNFVAERREIHALLGENGAGKSTLIKLIMGVTSPDSGVIRVEGKEARLRSPRDARECGIKIIPQEVEACEQMTVGRNVMLGLESPFVRRGKIRSAERARIEQAFSVIGARVDPDRRAGNLSVPEMRLAQIARTLIAPGRILLCDEPTAVLAESDAEALLDRLVSIRDDAGATVVYVTHRLSEVLRIADRVTVLRDGHNVGTFPREQMARNQLVELMTKDTAERRRSRPSLDIAAVRRKGTLEVSALGDGRDFADVSLTVTSGRVVGLAGVQGAGFGAVLAAIAGRRPYESGVVSLDGQALLPGSTRAACKAGIELVPADRRRAGIAAPLNVRENIALPVTGALTRFGIRKRRSERDVARKYSETFDIRGGGPETVAGDLSGGNQQKVAIARVIQARPRFLLLEEPTQGIDVHAKAEIRELVERLVHEEGLGALIASSEFEDLLGYANVIHVMRLGRIVATLDGHETTYGQILDASLP
jgi:ABC-type sugar transport system ATPase subunit